MVTIGSTARPTYANAKCGPWTWIRSFCFSRSALPNHINESWLLSFYFPHTKHVAQNFSSNAPPPVWRFCIHSAPLMPYQQIIPTLHPAACTLQLLPLLLVQNNKSKRNTSTACDATSRALWKLCNTLSCTVCLAKQKVSRATGQAGRTIDNTAESQRKRFLPLQNVCLILYSTQLLFYCPFFLPVMRCTTPFQKQITE